LAKGLVQRRRDPHDRRAILVAPTRRGAELNAAIRTARGTQAGRLFEQLSATDRAHAVLADRRLAHLAPTTPWLIVQDPKLRQPQAMPEQFRAVRIRLNEVAHFCAATGRRVNARHCLAPLAWIADLDIVRAGACDHEHRFAGVDAASGDRMQLRLDVLGLGVYCEPLFTVPRLGCFALL
jgi:DNA-binding MarR family transcriptional regulator